jgi:sugar/nucleoside kinase (ribokinase family)
MKGDCFTSAFFVRFSELMNKGDLQQIYHQCMIFANASAFLTITKLGFYFTFRRYE